MSRKRQDRGTFGDWLYGARRAHGWKTIEAARVEVGRLTGKTFDYSTWSQWENGRRPPNEDSLEILERVFGPAPAVPVTPSEPPVAEALEELTAAVRELIAEVHALREERE